MLARCTAKQEALERQKVRFDVANYDRLNASDILSGYLSHVHSSRESEIEMVKQLQLKYEVRCFRFTNIPSTPKSVDYERNGITCRLKVQTKTFTSESLPDIDRNKNFTYSPQGPVYFDH